MKKKTLLKMMVLLVGVIFAFTLTGCDMGGDDDGGSGGGGQTAITGTVTIMVDPNDTTDNDGKPDVGESIIYSVSGGNCPPTNIADWFTAPSPTGPWTLRENGLNFYLGGLSFDVLGLYIKCEVYDTRADAHPDKKTGRLTSNIIGPVVND
jgi:hypothetical protein